MSLLRSRARASASESRFPSCTLSRMVLSAASIRTALPHLLQDTLFRPRLPRDAGEEDRKGYPFPFPVVQLDRTAVLLHDRVDDGEPQPRPLRLRREKRVEDL